MINSKFCVSEILKETRDKPHTYCLELAPRKQFLKQIFMQEVFLASVLRNNTCKPMKTIGFRGKSWAVVKSWQRFHPVLGESPGTGIVLHSCPRGDGLCNCGSQLLLWADSVRRWKPQQRSSWVGGIKATKVVQLRGEIPEANTPRSWQ